MYLYGIEIFFVFWFKPSYSVLIVPLWNWNRHNLGGPAPDLCSNCTFMELKYDNRLRYPVVLLVLIVPLWNWNWWTGSLPWAEIRSNCTFMELKFSNCIYYQLIISVIHHKWLKRLPWRAWLHVIPFCSKKHFV